MFAVNLGTLHGEKIRRKRLFMIYQEIQGILEKTDTRTQTDGYERRTAMTDSYDGKL